MRRPSGEIMALSSGPDRSVSGTIEPSSSDIQKTSEFRGSCSQSSWRLAERTSALLSGVHEGDPPWLNGPEVTWRGVPPSPGSTNRWVWPVSRKPCPSARYCTLSIYLAGAAQSAPSGFSGSSAKGICCSGTNMENAIHWPSGDHASPPGDFVSCVSLAICPVSIQRT